MSYTQEQVHEMLKNIAKASAETRGVFENRFDNYDKELAALKAQGNQIETAVARRQMGGGGYSSEPSQASTEHKQKFLAWARKGSDPEGLRALEIQANLSTLSDPDGGYLVPIELEKSIEKLALASVAMRRIARVIRSKGEYTKPLSAGAAGGGWVSEKEDRDETDTPELKLFSPMMAEIYAMPSCTQKLLDMSDFDIEAWLLEEINDVFVTTEGGGFIIGNGVGRVKGIIDAALMIANASWTYGKTGYIAGGHASLLNNADKLIDLQHSLKPIYRQNGSWLMNDATLATVRKFKDGDGNYVWKPGLMENTPDLLLGKPIAVDDNMPDVGASTYPIAFGDFQRCYTIIDHVSGIRLLRDPYTKKGFVNFYVTKRLAGGISNYEAIKFLKIATV